MSASVAARVGQAKVS